MACTDKRAEIAVIGGTGFYEFLDNATEITVNTPYGHPSDAISLINRREENRVPAQARQEAPVSTPHGKLQG